MMTTSRANTDTPQARFLSGRELRPSDIYPAAVGIFESMSESYERVGIAVNEHDTQAPEYARAYRSRINNELHIVYYPGKDVEHTKKGVTAHYVDELTQPARQQLGTLIDTETLNKATKHFMIAQAGEYGPTVARHFVYACYRENRLTIEDSKNPLFSYKTKEYLEKAIRPEVDEEGYLHVSSEPRVVQHGLQTNLIDKPLCGHYALQALRRNLAGEPIPKLTVFERNPLLKYFIAGAIVIAGLALLGVGAAATFGVLPAILIPVGFAVGGTLVASGIIGGLISKFKKPKHNYHISPEHQQDHLNYYEAGKKSIRAGEPDQYSSSEARIRHSLSNGDLERLAPKTSTHIVPTEETRLITTESEVHSGDDFEIPAPSQSRHSFCAIL